MRRVVGLLLFIAVVSPPTIHLGSIAQELPAADTPSVQPPPVQKLEEQLEGPLDAEEIVAATGWINSTGIVDWLGPLAPVALSPFFGVTCLSGLALWGPQWATDNAVLQSSGPLKNEALFGVFLLLTVLTSLPRLTKISKPFAQALDQLETYAVIVILLAIKIVSSMEAPSSQPPGDPQIAMVQLGMVSFTVDTLLAIAMVINILVINSVKFFFEFMVWLTPIPFLDAVFEVCNKTVCGVLMAIYAISPTVATVINLLMLLVAAIVLRWISRRVRFYRTMILDPILTRFWRPYGKPKRAELIVFPKTDFGPLPAKSRLRLRPAEDGNGGWNLTEANWWMPCKKHTLAASPQPRVRRGWIMHAIDVENESGDPITLSFSRRYDEKTLEALVEQLGMRMSDQTVQQTKDALAFEFG